MAKASRLENTITNQLPGRCFWRDAIGRTAGWVAGYNLPDRGDQDPFNAFLIFFPHSHETRDSS